MDLLDFARGPALRWSLTIMFVGIAWRLIGILLLARKPDRSAPRGALAHWIVIKNGKIANYQAVVPSTWNAGPRDAAGQDGPYEAALKGHRLHDPKQPIEILRTIHSFDPCIACAVHVTDQNGEEMVRVKVV